jgi:hypothetical protein
MLMLMCASSFVMASGTNEFYVNPGSQRLSHLSAVFPVPELENNTKYHIVSEVLYGRTSWVCYNLFCLKLEITSYKRCEMCIVSD